MIGLVQLLLVGLALFWIGAVAYVVWGLTHPPRRTYASAVARQMPGDPSELDTPRDWDTWTVRVANAKREAEVWSVLGDAPEGPVLVLVHGWGDSRIGGLVRLPYLAKRAARVVLFDLPGHGATEGACQLGTREVDDTRAVLDRVAEVYPGAEIELYGWSLGAGVAIAAATHERVARVIAEAPYRLAITPARNVIREAGLPWRTNLRPALALLGLRFGVGLLWRGFDRAEHAARLGGTPLLVVHGDRDRICPLDEGRTIAEAAPNGELAIIEQGGHNDLWTDPDLTPRVVAAIERARETNA